jgi:RND family efflux transporter MFP subunit
LGNVLIRLVAMAMAASVPAAACSSGAKPSGEVAIGVRTAPVEQRAIAAPLDLSGNLVAAQSVQLAATVSGRLVELRVRIGDRVHLGEPLAIVDDSTYRAQQAQASGELARAQADRSAAAAGYQAAQAHFALSRVTEARMARLYAAGAVARQAYDQAHSDYLAAGAAVGQARAGIAEGSGLQAAAAGALAAASTALGDTVVRAPFDGVVTAKYVDPGSVVAPGVPILGVQSDGTLEVDVAVPQNAIGASAVGQLLTVRVDALDRRTVARIRSITPMNDPATRSALVKLVLSPLAGAASGMYARVELPGVAKQGRAVPLAALVTRAGQTGVFVIAKRHATFVPVRTGSADAHYVLVDGLRYGDREVAVSGTESLTDGSVVAGSQ